jgi:hypothetical protein
MLNRTGEASVQYKDKKFHTTFHMESLTNAKQNWQDLLNLNLSLWMAPLL